MDKEVQAQRDFSAGQIDDTALRREDTDILKAAVRKARNMRILNTGALKRRPGRLKLFETKGITEKIRPASGDYWLMTFTAGAISFRRENLTNVVTFTGMPWSEGILRDLRFVVSGGNVIVCHQSFQSRAFSFNVATSVWSYALFEFAVDPTGASRQPFFQFAPGTAVTMQPSARTGAVTITFSAASLVAAHAGLLFRYANRQVRIDTVLSATSANATIIEQLPPTFRITLDNVDGLQAGDVVEGLDSATKGQVISVDTAAKTAVVLITRNWNGFTGTEKILGPRSKGTFSAQTEISPAATTQWEEQFISEYRGWPGCIGYDSQRLILTRFAQYGPAVLWSSVGTLNDFRIGTEADDAMFEFVPDNCTVIEFSGGADEVFLTDIGPYIQLISASNPLKPGSFAPRLISNDGCAAVKPKQTTDGLIYVNSGKTRILAIVGTGSATSTRPYDVFELTEFHTSLIKTPVCLAVTSADVGNAERYLYVCNSDGTLAVARYQKPTTRQSYMGWVPWDGAGAVQWVTAAGTSVLVNATYQNGASFAETFSDDVLVDAASAISNGGLDPLEVTPGDPLEIGDSAVLDIGSSFVFQWAAGTKLSVLQNGWYQGDYTVGLDGSLLVSASTPIGLIAGYNFACEVEPFIHQAAAGQSVHQRMRRRRVARVAAAVLRSQAMQVGGKLFPFYRAGENQEQAPPQRNDTLRARFLGRDFDPRWSVLQDLPGQFTLAELTTEITI